MKAVKFNKEPATLIVILQQPESYEEYVDKINMNQDILVLHTKMYR